MTNKLHLYRATRSDLESIHAMENTDDTREYISGYSLLEHQEAWAAREVVYLKILEHECLVGFFILAYDLDKASVEFRRIVVAPDSRGVGQLAIPLMERYCVEVMGRRRIWLDVFEDNIRARHVYEKLGYAQVSSREHGERCLLIYEKNLGP